MTFGKDERHTHTHSIRSNPLIYIVTQEVEKNNVTTHANKISLPSTTSDESVD
jgi:hypothetical protein